jgi:flagellar export protein FliJ
MAKFVFKLDGLLRARKRAEQECQRALAVVVAEHVKKRADAADAVAKIESELNDLREKHLVGPINLAYLTSHRRFTADMRRRAAQLDAAASEAAGRVEIARQSLMAAGVAVKVIEKLREKQLARWNADADRKVTAALDEVSMQIGRIVEQDAAAESAEAGDA